MAKLGLAPVVTGSTAWLVAVGDLTQHTASVVARAVDEVLAEGVTRLTIDLRQVACSDSASVDELVEASKRARDRNVSIRVFAGDELRDMFEEAKTMALFTAIDDALATVESMGALLDVCRDDEMAPPAAETVTWVATP